MFSRLRERVAQAVQGDDQTPDQDVNLAPAAEEGGVESSAHSRNPDGSDKNDDRKDDKNENDSKRSMFSVFRFASGNPIGETSTHSKNPEDTELISRVAQHVTNRLGNNSTHIDPAELEEINRDPEVSRLRGNIAHLQSELDALKNSGRSTQKRRNKETDEMKRYINSKLREIWLEQQKSRRFGLAQYRKEILKCSLPAHDTSNAVLAAEAKVLRAQHNGAIVDHQLSVVHSFQEEIIEYLHQTALPDVKNEHELARMVGKNQLEKFTVSKQQMVDMFEDCLGLQRKIIAKLRLRELEHCRPGQTEDDELEKEHLNILAGEVPAMVRDAELRDSAKDRLQRRLELRDEKVERRRSRESESFEDSGEGELTALERAQEQIRRLSNHSVELNLKLDQDDMEEDDDGGECNDDVIDSPKEDDEERIASTRNGDEDVTESEMSGGDEPPTLSSHDSEVEVPTSTDQNVAEDSKHDFSNEIGAKENGFHESEDAVESEERSDILGSTGDSQTAATESTNVAAHEMSLPTDVETSPASPQEAPQGKDATVNDEKDSLGTDIVSPPTQSPMTPRSRLAARQTGTAGGTTTSRPGGRPDLLERARLARQQHQEGGGPATNTAATRVRPTVSRRPVTSDAGTTRRSVSRPSGVAGGSYASRQQEDTPSAPSVSSGVSPRPARPTAGVRPATRRPADRSRPDGGASSSLAEREARKERLASRRKATSGPGSSTTPSAAAAGISAERRAQLRNNLNKRGIAGRAQPGGG
eukprot:Nitzschia sp. Nitz4//scaffold416_size9149//1197//3470//NITZ4_009103-RA/size9149-processed-gene-0.4-mRNA-1//-1//CDS//3329551364//908//frame0